MIAALSGLVAELREDAVVLDVNGVGYLVACSGRTLSALPGRGEAAALQIETIVREDAINLFGFASRAEQDWFNLLRGVQGVGAKVALGILATLSADELAGAILAQDKATLSRAPSVGPKLAQRIASELKDKVGGLGALPAMADGGAAGGAAGGVAAATDAVSALVNLGYRPAEAQNAVQAGLARLGAEAAVEALIREGLKELAP